MKKKFGDRSDWKRLIKRAYVQDHIQLAGFSGYVTLIRMDKVAEPLFVRYGDKKICIADDGYMWLQQFPDGEFHAVTTMFDASGGIVQWYIDICLGNELDERNVPFFRDLYLDIIVLPDGEVIRKDADELEEALRDGIVSESDYKLASTEWWNLIDRIGNGQFELFGRSAAHRDLLLNKGMN